MKEYQTKNPYNGSVIATYSQDTAATINSKLDKAIAIEATWADMEIADRCQLLTNVAESFLASYSLCRSNIDRW